MRIHGKPISMQEEQTNNEGRLQISGIKICENASLKPTNCTAQLTKSCQHISRVVGDKLIELQALSDPNGFLVATNQKVIWA